jgi:hypothetical protein
MEQEVIEPNAGELLTAFEVEDYLRKYRIVTRMIEQLGEQNK